MESKLLEKVTIIIPTRDRSDVLGPCIRAALSLQYPNLNVLVSDNASIDDTEKVVKDFDDSRLKYIRTPKRVSMSSNWEFALLHVKEGWVTVIGDDDAVLAGGIERALEIAVETGVSAVRSDICSYKWPSLLDGEYGQLLIPLRSGYKVLNATNMLQSVLDGYEHYSTLPVLYNGGFMRIRLVQEIAELSDRFILSPTPDVYSAVAFCAKIDEYAYSFEPLAINGASAHSGGTAAFNPRRIGGRTHTAPAEKYLKEIDSPFHSSVPLMADGSVIPSIQAIVYESFQQAKAIFSFNGIQVDAMRQMQLILAEAKLAGNSEAVRGWAPSFLGANGLSKELNANVHLWAILRLRKRRFKKLIGYLNINLLKGCDKMPLLDVYQAVVAVGVIKDLSPSKPTNWLRRVLEFLRR